MRIKRTVSLAIAVALAIGCAKSYVPAGAEPPLDATGTYYVRETLYSGTCASLQARKERFIVEVKHSPGAGLFKLVTGGQSYDGQVQSSGVFSIGVQTTPGSGSATSMKTSMNGRFTSTGFMARWLVQTLEPVRAIRPGDPATRTCDYQFRWEAERQ